MWRNILVCVSISLVLIGIVPWIYLRWWGNPDNLEPLSMPLPLKRGEYESPFFTTELDDVYQVDVYTIRSPLYLDWKIVDDAGTPIVSGTYLNQQFGGNDVILGHYHARRGLHQKAILSIRQDIQDTHSDTRLHVGLPERGLGQSYAIGAAALWAAFVGGVGAIALFSLLGSPRRRRFK